MKKQIKIAPYNHAKIEKKWQKKWESSKLYKAKEVKGMKKFYGLIEFPYPSGDGLHVGHIRSNTAMDIIARKRRREGFSVLYPIGYDAFGLPTENYAIKTGIQPAKVTKQNTAIFRKQLKSLGFSFDWSREIDTTDPKYYKWTQWIFLQLYKKGLAYKKKMAINWCPKDLIGLANEEVINGHCERCDTPVEKREIEQWMLAITKYADRLDKDLDDVDYLEKIKIQQRNWIGKSEGAMIKFQLSNISAGTVEVFTTRPDTLFGVTYIVLAPEHKLINELLNSITNKAEVEEYIKKAKSETDIQRTDVTKEKTGVELKGITAVNPANDEKISVWVADYVLADYGTGAVMAVPAHDERDWDFAKKYNLNAKQVIAPFFTEVTGADAPRVDKKTAERRNIYAIVKHCTEDKFIGLDWKDNKWHSLIIGGVENNEDIVTTAIREIQEETGYKNIKFIRNIGHETHANHFAPHKDINRYSFCNTLYFELINEEQNIIEESEKNKHNVVWVERNKMCEFLNLKNNSYIWNIFQNGDCAYTGDGKLINSAQFDNRNSVEIKKDITKFVGGEWVTKYKLRDWIFSRQHYWGEPIPLINCDKCGLVPVPEKDLPVVLPKVKNYKPTGTGESPLAAISKWVNTKCPICKSKARRETDTMPNWAGSSWYYLRYTDSKNKKNFADLDKLKYWTPVDWYNGGMEHTTLHLLYSRFWHKFLFDQGLVPTCEPYKKRTSHGLILAEGGEKMSKSKGNVINPDSIVGAVGADALRIYEMFMGPFDQPIAWDTNNIAGSRRFIERAWKLCEKISDASNNLDNILHKTIKKVTDDIEEMRFNTAISSLMILLNEMEKTNSVSKGQYEILLQLIAPFAPHFTEELWSKIGNKKSIHISDWPKYDESKARDNDVKIMIQVDSKVRGSLTVGADANRDDIEKTAKELPEIIKWLENKKINKVIFVPNRLINFVTVQ